MQGVACAAHPAPGAGEVKPEPALPPPVARVHSRCAPGLLSSLPRLQAQTQTHDFHHARRALEPWKGAISNRQLRITATG